MSLVLLLKSNEGATAPEEPRWATVSAPVRPSWDEAVRASRKIATRATVLSNGSPVAELPILDGSVTLDANAASRGRCDLTLADDGTLNLVPDAPTSLLAPYGNEIRVERGIEHAELEQPSWCRSASSRSTTRTSTTAETT